MKKVLIALASIALFAGCSADGIFYCNPIENSLCVEWSNNDEEEPSPPDNNTPVNCQIGSACYTQQLTQSQCSINGGTVVSSCPSNNTLVNCQIGSACYTQQLTQSQCATNGGTVVSSCSSSSAQYCYNGGDCDLIGGTYAQTAEECRNYYDGQVYTYQQCVNVGAHFYN